MRWRLYVVENGGPGGGRWIEVAPDRLDRWLESFAERHGGATTDPGEATVTFRAADGAVAECHVPFPPLATGDTEGSGSAPGAAGGTARYGELITAHARADRTVGVFLVRLGGYAAGVFSGSPPQLTASKVGSRLVHGRS